MESISAEAAGALNYYYYYYYYYYRRTKEEDRGGSRTRQVESTLLAFLILDRGGKNDTMLGLEQSLKKTTLVTAPRLPMMIRPRGVGVAVVL